MSFIVDSYSESNKDQQYGFADFTKRIGQSFTGKYGILVSVKFYIEKTGSPTGTATAKIYSHSGTYGTSSIPTGSALAESSPMNLADAAESMQLEEFVFSGENQITLTKGTYYCVSLEYNDDGSVNSSNRWAIGVDGSSPTHSGNLYTYVSSYAAQASDDLIFYVYAEKTGPFPTHFRQ